MSTPIEFFFDVGSPYSYLASTQLEALADRLGDADIHWRPFLLGAVFKSVGGGPGISPAKGQYLTRDLQMWAESYGVPFEMSSRFPLNTLKPQRALVSAGELASRRGEDRNAAIRQLADGLFEAYWVDDRDVSSIDVIADVAREVGHADVESLLAGVDDQAIKDILRETTGEAVERGAFGAPTFFVGDEMFWGNDRLSFVEQAAGEGDSSARSG